MTIARKRYRSYDIQALPTVRNDQNILLGGGVAELPQDEAIYSELEKLGTDIKVIRAAKFTHLQLLVIFDFLKRQEKK